MNVLSGIGKSALAGLAGLTILAGATLAPESAAAQPFGHGWRGGGHHYGWVHVRRPPHRFVYYCAPRRVWVPGRFGWRQVWRRSC